MVSERTLSASYAATTGTCGALAAGTGAGFTTGLRGLAGGNGLGSAGSGSWVGIDSSTIGAGGLGEGRRNMLQAGRARTKTNNGSNAAPGPTDELGNPRE
ncbi:MAG: hypothetical protein JSS59_01505 [Proteobacteria bacterium]|nr:hypothetical protein [Pseudomonadota bacterium]